MKKKPFDFEKSLDKFVNYCENLSWQLLDENNMNVKRNKKVHTIKKAAFRASYLKERLTYLRQNSNAPFTNKVILSQFAKCFYSHEIGMMEASKAFSSKFLDALENLFDENSKMNVIEKTTTKSNVITSSPKEKIVTMLQEQVDIKSESPATLIQLSLF